MPVPFFHRVRSVRVAIPLVAAVAGLWLAPTPGAQQPAETTWRLVTRVVDGDTIIVDGVGRVRLIGVDTPELVDPRRPVQHFAKEASEFTRRVADGRRVRLEYDVERTDRYGRTLAYVFLADGTFLNAEIIRQGYGHAYTRFPFEHLEEFRRLEREAREHKRGLWADDESQEGQRVAPLGQPPAEPARATGNKAAGQTVYVTRTGARYHRTDCRHLARSRIPMPLSEAAARYAPCSTCRPPRP